ncbi:16025_t:CDS:1, partial [Dentiscutata heterogama]
LRVQNPPRTENSNNYLCYGNRLSSISWDRIPVTMVALARLVDL